MWMEQTLGVQKAKIDDCLADHGFLCGVDAALQCDQRNTFDFA